MERLINKSYPSYANISRYSTFPIYYDKIDNKYISGITAQLKKDINYIIHTIKHEESLDTLALYYYNNPTYFWVIADFNNIQDPYEELKEGSKLKIPTFSNIEFDR